MKRFLMYLMTYILITFTTAFGVVLISNPTKATNQTVNVGGTSSGTEAESPLTYIVDNFTTLKGLNLDVNVDLVVKGAPINLLADVTIDLSGGFENVALSGTLTVTLESGATNIDFTFIDNTVYLSMLNGEYKITTTNLMETINQILTLLNVEIPDMGLDLENLDMNSLLGLLNNVTETKTETGTTLSVYIPGLGNASLICDLNYQIKKITLPKTTLNDFTFKVSVDASYPQDCTVEVPKTDAIDLTHVFNLAEGLINFVTQNKIAVNMVVDYNNTQITGNLVADIENKNATFNTLINNKPLVVTLINNVVYVEFENIYVKADLTKINEVVNLFEQELGITLPLEQISSTLQGTSTLQLNTNTLNLNNFDINSIDLGILEEFEYEDGVYRVVIKDSCELTFTFNNHEFNNITFVGYGAQAKLTSITPTEIKLNEQAENYVDVYEMLPTLNAMLNTLQLKHHFGTISLNFNDVLVSANYNIYLNNGLTMQLNANVLDTPINLNVVNNKIYFSFKEINIVCNQNEINTLINFVNDYFNISANNIDSSTIQNAINKILDSTSLLISEFERTENRLDLEVLSKVKVTINHSNLLEEVSVTANNINVSATVNSDNEPLNISVNESDYVSVTNVYEMVNNIVNYVKNGKFYFNTTLTIDNYSLNGFINAYNITQNGLTLEAQLQTTILGKQVVICLQNNTVYLSVDGFNLKFAISETEQLINFIENNLGYEIADVTETTISALTNTKLPTTLNGLNLKLTNNSFEITYSNANIVIDLTNNTLNSVNLTYNNITANIAVQKQKQFVELQEKYINLTDLLPFAQSVINTASATKLEGTALIIVNNYALNAKFRVCYANEPQIWIQTQINGAKLTINYYNEQILISVDDLNLKAGANELDKIIEFVNTTFGLEVSTDEINNTVNTLNIEDLLNNINFGELLNIVATQNTFGINTFGVNVFATFTEYVNSINVTYNNVYADIKFNTFGNEVYMPVINTLAYEPIDYVLEAVKTTKQGIENKNVSINGTIKIDNFELPINLQLLQDKVTKLNFNTTLYNKELDAILINDTIYATIDGLKVKYNLSELNELINLVENTFGFNLTETISDLQNTNINTTQLINNLIIYNISKSTLNNGYVLCVSLGLNNKLVNINLTLVENKLANIAFNYNNISANLNINFGTVTNINVVEETYLTNLADVTTIITPTNNLVNAGKFELNGVVKVNAFNQDITINNLAIDFNDINNLKAYANVSVFGLNAEVTLQNNIIYINAHGLKIYEEVKNINNLIAWANDTFGLNINTTSLDTSTLGVEETLNTFTFGELIVSMAKTPNGLIINLPSYTNTSGTSETQNINLSYTDTFTTAIINLNGIYANLNFVNFGNNVNIAYVNTTEYEHINYLLNSVKNVYNNTTTNNATLNGNIKINEFNLPVTIQVDYAKDLNAKINTTLYGKELELILIDQTIYLNVDGFKAKYDLSNLNELINLLDSTFNLNISETLEDATNSFDVNNLVVDTLTKVNTENGYSLTVNVTYEKHNITANINFNTNNELSSVDVVYSDMVNATLQTTFGNIENFNLSETQIATYATNLQDVTTLITPANNLINADKIELTGNVTFNILGDDYTLTVTNLKVDYSNLENIKAMAKATFLGFDITLAYLNNTIYVGVDNLKTYIATNEIQDLIDWINTTFNTTLELPKQEPITEVKITELLGNFTLGDIINSITRTPNGVMVNLPVYYNEDGVSNTQEIVVSYNSNFTNIIVNHELVYAELNFINYGNIVSDIEFTQTELNTFVHYTELTTLTETIDEFIIGKQYATTANALIYNGNELRYNVELGLRIDVLDGLKVNGYADVTGEQNVGFDLDYWNEYLFINYEGLKLKICESDIKGLISVILNLFGVDPSLIPFLEDAAEDLNNVNFDSVSNLMPEIDFGNPISLLNLVSNLSYQNGNLEVTIDGSKLSENPNAKEMYFTLNTNSGKLSNLSLTNIYTGVTENEYFNLNIDITDFTEIAGLTETEQATYHDLSGATELIKAVINTAELNYYEIDGSVIVNGNLIGIDINWDIPLNVKIKLDEQRKPEIMFTLGSIPAVVGVNNDVPYEFGDTESGSDRMVYIYYKDEYVYFHRTEYVDIVFGAGKRRYEKKLKEHISTVFNDPLYYLQYCVGFTDSIMDAIKESLELSKGHTPNPGNVLNSFVVKDNMNFTLDLNMQEITNDPKMGNMAVGVGVINTEQTNNKNYVGNATFSMFMPLADVFELTLSSNNLQLINIGKELDFTNLYNYINTYTFDEGKEYEATWNKDEDGENHDNDWTLASERTYTLSFEENGGATVNDITATYNSNITLPNYTSNLLIVDESTGTRTSYRFEGWFTTSNFKDGTQFTQTTMPRGDKTLYAKWIVVAVDYVRTITFNSNGGSSIESVSELAGVWIDLSYKVPTKDTTYVDEGYNWLGSHAGKWTYKVTTYTFVGWYTDSSLTTQFDGYMPNYNTTLYAKWTSNTTTEYYYNWERP